MIPNKRQMEPVLTVEVTIKDFPQLLTIRDTCTVIFAALGLNSSHESQSDEKVITMLRKLFRYCCYTLLPEPNNIQELNTLKVNSNTKML